MTAYYDPENPELSVLERGAVTSNLILTAICGVTLVVLGIALAASAMLMT